MYRLLDIYRDYLNKNVDKNQRRNKDIRIDGLSMAVSTLAMDNSSDTHNPSRTDNKSYIKIKNYYNPNIHHHFSKWSACGTRLDY